MTLPKTEADHVTRSAAHLSLIEVFFGSIIHSFKIPLGGHLLSINQGVFLCRSSSLAPSRIIASKWAYEISGVSAALKSLSPAGGKLGPMLSISMQGMLYAFGNLIAGRSPLGQSLGMILLSLWAFAQPLITLWISFGQKNISDLFEFYQNKQTAEFSFLGITFWSALLAFVLVKMVICALVPFILNSFSVEQLDQIESKILHKAKNQFTDSSLLMLDLKRPKDHSPMVGALRDLTRPLFLISFVLMILFWSIRSPDWANTVWLSMRPLAVAFIIFYLLRSPLFIDCISSVSQKTAPFRAIRARTLKVRDYLSALNR